MATEDPKMEIEVPRPGAPEPKPSARRWTLKKVGGLIAAFAAVGTVLAGLAGYWTTYRTITKDNSRAREARADSRRVFRLLYFRSRTLPGMRRRTISEMSSPRS
jgi:hypothetical protein